MERGKPDRQASLVVDPPDGRTPPLTPAGQAAVKALSGGLGPGSHFPDKVDSWKDFDIYSRCITRGMVSSMLPTLYNFGNEILQAPGYVIIRNEMIHETRVIPLDGRPHAGKGIVTYMGDSRGHWEGNTLVVETTNLKASARRRRWTVHRCRGPDRAFHAHLAEGAELRSDRQRSQNLDQTLDPSHAIQAGSRATRSTSTPATKATT